MRIEEIEKLLNEATPEPWQWMNHGCVGLIGDNNIIFTSDDINIEPKNAKLIATAPTIIRQLLDENKKMLKAIQWVLTHPERETRLNYLRQAIESTNEKGSG